MTVRFLALYETPTDPDTFDRHYREVHVPLGRRLPGLRRYTVGRNVAAVRGEGPYHLVAELEWDTMDELRAAFASPEGRAAADDAARLQELAPVRSMIFVVEESVG
ncbi:EthD family reductase [Rugosimonospora acidiphila]|uniref:EthD family reductase n=1 Tax=Rugosimonospora acidiphila TaxID=556531 RepID=A0ABP9SRZ1_9ACTN